jgi:outer membrane autotransporter protein
MAGIYALQQLGGLRVSGQAVYGRSDWDASRGLPLFARTATSSFKSTEVRASLRVDYSIDINTGFELTPFARGEVRYFRFDGFDETGAGSIGLSVERRSKTVFTPEVGMRIGGSPDNGSRIRPFAEGSYLLQGDPGTDRVMNFLGDGATVFRAEGVRPDDAIKAAVGVTADMSRMTLFARADYASGGRQQVGSVRGGALFKF